MNENLNPEKDNFSAEELDVEKKLRPLTFDDFTGQEQVLENLKIFESSNGLVNKITDSNNKVITLKGDFFEGELKDKFGFKSVYYEVVGNKFKLIKINS